MSNDAEILALLIDMSNKIAHMETIQSQQTTLQTEQNDELKRLKNAVETIPKEAHVEDHEYLETLRKREQSKVDFWNAVKVKVMSNGVLGLVSALGLVFIYAFNMYTGAEVPTPK